MKAIKLGWGGRIAILYIGFVVLILTLVVNSMRQSFDLVTPDYYEQEIRYQQTIDAGRNQAALSSPVAISKNEKAVVLLFPQEFNKRNISGTVRFYVPANAGWDREINIETSNSYIDIPREKLANTGYVVKISWRCDGKDYYQESKLTLR